MGQYYKPIAIREGKGFFMNAHDYDNGLKLMEHSYLKNNFVKTFEQQIANNPAMVIWAGDYADNEETTSPLFNPQVILDNKASDKEREGYTLYSLCFVKKYNKRE